MKVFGWCMRLCVVIGVPVILVGDKRMNGFDEARLTDMLRGAGYSI